MKSFNRVYGKFRVVQERYRGRRKERTRRTSHSHLPSYQSALSAARQLLELQICLSRNADLEARLVLQLYHWFVSPSYPTWALVKRSRRSLFAAARLDDSVFTASRAYQSNQLSSRGRIETRKYILLSTESIWRHGRSSGSTPLFSQLATILYRGPEETIEAT